MKGSLIFSLAFGGLLVAALLSQNAIDRRNQATIARAQAEVRREDSRRTKPATDQPRADAAQGDPASGSSSSNFTLPPETKPLAVSSLEDLASYSDEMLPTAEGLYASTVALWSDESFLDLTADEARSLLPLDENLPLSGHLSLVKLLGGLPTRDDCEAAMRDGRVVGALEHACELELDLVALASLPAERRGPAFRSALGTAKANWTSAELELMHELERTTHYPHWTILWRLYQEWVK